MQFDIEENSHRRFNMLTGEWVQVSPHRTKRPWQGQREGESLESRPSYDPDCYLCPGNTRVSGEINPEYDSVYVFDNDFGALQKDVPNSSEDQGFFRYKSERGICRVICFSPDHSLTIPEMSVSDIAIVVGTWMKECRELSQLDFVNHIQIFENKGAIMGCSNPHPHGQIWAQETVPDEPHKKQIQQRRYYEENQASLVGDYLKEELQAGERVIIENEHFVVLVPYWSVWPFETIIIPKRHMKRITEMNTEEVQAYADVFKRITTRYDNLFRTSFPYSAGIHQAPYDKKDHNEWHWHMMFYPPLLRSAEVKKFMVGYEMLGNPQRDITAERSAQMLRDVSEIHYKN